MRAGVLKFSARHRRGVVVLAVAVIVIVGLLMPGLRSDTILVPVRSDRRGGLDARDDIVISIYPPVHVQNEGDSFRLVCTVSGADHVEFELPESLDYDLKSSLEITQQYGSAKLTFAKLSLRHRGTYVCHARRTQTGLEKRRYFEIMVLPVLEGDTYQGEGDVEVEEDGEVNIRDRALKKEWEVEGEEEGKEEEGEEEGEEEKEEGEEEKQYGQDGEKEGKEGVEEEKPRKGEKMVENEEEGVDDKKPKGIDGKVDEYDGGVEEGLGGGRNKAKEGRDGAVKEENEEKEVVGEIPKEEFIVPVFETMEERAKYQREKVDEFCTRYGMDDIKYQLPTPSPDRRIKDNEVYSYNRHLIVDPRHRILFCFVPKVGCTNLKLLVFVGRGLIRRSELAKSRDGVNQRKLEAAMSRSSFISVHDDDRKKNVLRTYYKYTMFRNPLERLASGYRSKVERFPLVGLKQDEPHFNWLRRDIYSATHTWDYRMWKIDKGKTPVNISFADFVEYWSNNEVVNKVDGFLDEHFLMISEMCQPCRTRFDFYGNFNHFDRDAQVLMDKIGSRSSDLRQGYYSDEGAVTTNQKMRAYYSTLSDSQKKDVLRKMALELEFHYTIFPEERDSHKQILGIDIDLPL